MYMFKEELVEQVMNKYKVTNMGDVVGITKGYISQIINRKKTCPKKTAYAIVKYFDSEAEVEDYFERLK